MLIFAKLMKVPKTHARIRIQNAGVAIVRFSGAVENARFLSTCSQEQYAVIPLFVFKTMKRITSTNLQVALNFTECRFQLPISYLNIKHAYLPKYDLNH